MPRPAIHGTPSGAGPAGSPKRRRPGPSGPTRRGDNPDYRKAKFSDYQERIPAADSLLDNNLGADDNPAYQAFAYPLFLSQEAGDRAPFEDFWKAARAPRTREALDDLLNTRLAFDRHFRDFAVKMLNLTLPGDPLAPLLETFDAP